MKLNKLEIIKKCLESEKLTLQRAINVAKQARDNAPSAMESHHDTERNQNENLVSALEHDLEKLNQAIDNIPDSIPNENGVVDIWSYIEIENDSGISKMILVPEGLGGREREDIRLISISTQMAMDILGKSKGDKVKAGNFRYQILKVL